MIMAENNHKAALTGEYLNQMPLFTTIFFHRLFATTC